MAQGRALVEQNLAMLLNIAGRFSLRFHLGLRKNNSRHLGTCEAQTPSDRASHPGRKNTGLDSWALRDRVAGVREADGAEDRENLCNPTSAIHL